MKRYRNLGWITHSRKADLLHGMSRLVALNDRPPFSERPSLTGHCGHGWTCRRFEPVANDPLRHLGSLLNRQCPRDCRVLV
jgi:hypothetical protein